MNLIGSRPDGWWRDRAAARRRLVDELQSFLVRTGEHGLVVFDGRPTEDEEEGEGERLSVRFAPGGPNAADRCIADVVAASDRPSDLTVVTSDGALAAEVERNGARVVGVGAFRRRLEGD